ncbi:MULTISPECIES: LysR family transcriptional regulator [unclassified Sphingopyxis]|jgi:DNA-binding transcriptional LysR family regulator|uniref:LysR family transcriptional regulator n=1 Tax=unclassified Sphingopyxis TaxID=2614943 RepID=UPI00285E9BE0|nr:MULTISPECIES: LysR family transcriptional regulator [unclassified Sphingopyxis]MDR6834650.1 DNA-binding transcriptional LysR family regulator [Sphingopyxis sp. BE122]MDR7226920.1 DNA-binding transcriptional LysR family regulator [Sphingopyxis sp. BE259]
MYDWNDLKAFLAVAETGSTLSAAQSLRVSQTTVARRIAALEAATGLNLFERRQAGYALTPVGQAMLASAAAVREAADRFGAAAGASSRDVGGTVSLTVMEIFAVTVLPPILRDLRAAHPGIHIHLDTADEHRDLAAGAADIAIRSSKQPTGAGLVGRRIADNPWTVYCSRDYADRHGIPHSREQLAAHPFIGGGGGVWKPYLAWLQQYGLEESVVMQYDSASGLLAGVRSGMGLTILPGFIANREPDLIRCIPPKKEDTTGLWLLTHERLRHVPRVRLVLDFLAQELAKLAREG